MEQVDIVDKQGKKLYTISKQEAHEKGLLHICVIAEIINSKGEWVMVRPAGHKQDAGQFVSPVGGHVTAGETIEEALKREAFEEMGVKDFIYTKRGSGIFDRKVLGRHENHFFHVFEIQSDSLPVLSDETASYEYFSFDELKKHLKENPTDFGDAFHFVVKNVYDDFASK